MTGACRGREEKKLFSDLKEILGQGGPRYMEMRQSFYREELAYLKQAKYPLPIHILYPVLHPGQALNPAQALDKKDFLLAMAIWKGILTALEKDPSITAQRAYYRL